MRITELKAENFKRLKAIDITPQEDVILITGANGAGKSSILDCITAAFKGQREIPEKPIRKGEDKGAIEIDLGDYLIIRNFTQKGAYLKVVQKSNGIEVQSPQKFMDDLVGKISFDPLEFMNEKNQGKRRQVLLDLIGVNTAKIDEVYAEVFEERRVNGREVTRLEGALESMPGHYGGFPDKEISVTELSQQLTGAIENNQKAHDAQKTIDNTREAISELESKLRKAESVLDTANLVLLGHELMPIDELETQIANAEETNQKVRANSDRDNIVQEFTTAATTNNVLTNRLETLKKTKDNLLASATMPIEGLSIDENGVLYKGVPLEQASDSEKLMVSLAISMALNPELRVLRIKDGSLIDERNMALIRQMVGERDFQIWVEKVDTSGQIGIYIEEGEIVEVAR